jgi:hypothetical protein
MKLILILMLTSCAHAPEKDYELLRRIRLLERKVSELEADVALLNATPPRDDESED